MCNRLEDIVSGLRHVVAHLDVDNLSGEDATLLLDTFASVEKLSEAGRTLVGLRVADTFAWRASGARTAAQFLASRAGQTVGAAIASLECARNLESAQATRRAFVSGHISETQAAEIASAAAADPSSEAGLLAIASTESVATLKDKAKDVRAAALSDEDWAERIRKRRFLRHWTDRDGAVRLHALLPPDDGGKLLATVERSAARLADEARRSGAQERLEAYEADALVGLVAGHERVHAVVNVHVDASALERGFLEPGETSRIEGVGPVPVVVARRLAGDADVRLIGRDGADVTSVVHLGRTIVSKVRSALEARDRTCVVPGCDARTNLEIDHIVPFALGGPTTLGNLARLCRHHHAKKTHHGWQLGGAPGSWTWTRTSGVGAKDAARRANVETRDRRDGVRTEDGRGPAARPP